MLSSLHETIRVFCWKAESRFGCAIFRTLRSVLWLFTSGVWDVLRYRILRKKQLLIIRKRGLRRFVLYAIVLMIFVQTFQKIMGDLIERKIPTFQNDVEYVPKMSNVFLSSAGLFSLVVTKINLFWELPQISLLETIRVFCTNAESRSGCASFRRLGLVLPLFTSCVWDVLEYRILIKTAFVSWAKQKLSETTLSTFQKRLFELCSAWFFGCN